MAENVQVLIVDDDKNMQALLQKVLVREGYATTLADNGEEALKCIGEQNFDIVLSDIRMPNMDGMTLLGKIQETSPETTVIMMTAFGSVDSAVEAMKQGAYDYISKPFKMDEVLIVLSRVVEEKQLRQELVSMREELAGRYSFANIIGKSAPMQQVFDLISRVATSAATVLIRGGSGTGKELVARAIHFNSPRKEQSFVPVNCSAIPGDLLESELFGHMKGSFTGAVANKRGLFVEADGGTILLDEIGEMSPDLQSKLLRVLQEKEVRPVGGTQHISVDARVIAATNQNLESQVEKGSFREDLYYRLNVIPLVLPALRERLEDIPLLVEHFLEKYAGEVGGKKSMSREALAVLMRHPWPGNVRELENVVERAAVLSMGAEIRPQDLPPEMGTASGGLLARSAEREASLEDLEKDYILLVLDRVDGNQTRAAEILGIDRRTLYRKLQSYNVEK